MSTIFSSTAFSYSRQMQNFQNNNKTSVEQVDMYKFQLMYSRVLRNLKNDIANLENGSYDALASFDENKYLIGLDASSFTAAAYNTTAITSLKGYTRDSLTFIEYRNIFNGIVTGIKAANTLNGRLSAANAANAQLQAELNTFRPLLSQLNASFNVNIYAEANVNITRTELLPWYAEYLYLYGPPNGPFDSTKLSYIVERQVQAGLYPLEDFLKTPKYIIN
jgi:hypothetical protein